MKTFFEIVENKTYRQLTQIEKDAIQDRQTQLVLDWQDETDEIKKEEIFDELHASLKGLIKGMAYKQAEKSYTVEQEDFEGIMNLTLVESLLTFDRSLEKPFQPIFIYNVRNEVKMMYRAKGYDLHDTTYDNPKEQRLDSDTGLRPDTNHPNIETVGTRMSTQNNDIVNLEHTVVTEQILTELFGNDDKKKTIVHMSVQGFKRNEIVSATLSEGKSPDAMAKMVNRTVSQFKEHYLNLINQ